MTTCPDRQLQPPWRCRQVWSVMAVLGVMLPNLVMAAPAQEALADEEAILAVVPLEAKIGVAWRGGGRKVGKEPRFVAQDAWTDFLFATVDGTVVPVESSWRSACRITDQLVPRRGLRCHACDAEGRRWIQVVHWEDPVSIERGLQRLGTKAMGRGRFRLPVTGIEVAVRDDWLVLGPQGSPWIDLALTGLAARPMLNNAKNNGAETSIGLFIRHESPIAGVTRMRLVPTSIDQASIELDGKYAAGPLPIRPATPMAAQAVESLQGRFALVVQESGVGLLDPRLVEVATEFPEVIPTASIRRAFAPNRLVVLDGESVDVSGVGFVEVPAIAVAVPLREISEDQVEAMNLEELEASVDQWLGLGAAAVRGSWDSDFKNEVSVTRQGGIRHLSLGPGFLGAMAGHPMALIGQLAWTLRMDPSQTRGWLVVGSSIGLVRRVADRLDAAPSGEARSDSAARSISMHAVATPSRIAGQVADLARLRSVGDDEDASEDANLLEKLAEILSGFQRIDWISRVQNEEQVQAHLEVRRILEPGADPEVSSENELVTTPTESP